MTSSSQPDQRTLVFTSFEDIEALVGQQIGISNWIVVDQAMIEAFGRTTGDQQWIHMDVERAATGPFGGTIAHGFLLLALLPAFGASTFDASTFTARINYGLERVRFLTPVRAGEKVRDRIAIERADRTASGLRVTFAHTLETPDGDKPACIAQAVTVFVL